MLIQLAKGAKQKDLRYPYEYDYSTCDLKVRARLTPAASHCSFIYYGFYYSISIAMRQALSSAIAAARRHRKNEETEVSDWTHGF